MIDLGRKASVNARWSKRERARVGIEPTTAAPSQPDYPGVSRSDHSAGTKDRLRDELLSYVRTDMYTVDWGLGGGRKRGEKQAEEAARTNRRRTKKRMAAERTARRDKSSPSSTSILISSRCSFGCHSLLCPAPVPAVCLFCLFLSPLSPFPQPPIDRVSPNVTYCYYYLRVQNFAILGFRRFCGY